MAKVLCNQTLLDIAIQEIGNADHWLDIAFLNGLIPTEGIKPGETLAIPKGIIKNNEVVNFLASKKIQPATAVSASVQEIIGTPALSCQEEIENCFK